MLLPPRKSAKEKTKNAFYGLSVVRISLIVFPLALIGWAYVSVVKMEVSNTLNTQQQRAKQAEPLSEIDQMESALRAQLDKTRIQPINWDKSFGDALQIDLSVMNIHVIKVSAPIKKWRGRRLNEPARATIDLTIRSRGENAKELSSIALVVGKYMRSYNMDVDEISVQSEEGDKVFIQEISPEVASKFFLERIDITEFLKSLLTSTPSE